MPALATKTSSWIAQRAKFIEAGGNFTQSFGFGRVIGQIYALLYLSPKPLCLDEIVAELGVSKASTSTTVRQLESWSAIRRVWVKGDRKDYYEAVLDFRAVLRGGILERVRRKLDSAGGHIEQVEQSLQETLAASTDGDREQMEIIAQRIARAKQFHGKLNSVLGSPLLDHFL